MASIFTYDPDPPRVASPWLRHAGLDPNSGIDAPNHITHTPNVEFARDSSLQEGMQPDRKVTRLQAEPQEGPVEYKLHLLLRPRRKFRHTSTGNHTLSARGSKSVDRRHIRDHAITAIEGGITFEPATSPSSSTYQTRQHRLEQLTTQLLWRLQQSSPHHTSSAKNIILPSLPEALPELRAPQKLAELLHGLEESRGALYEIGISDDGTLVGLADDEMQESLNNLRAMAACLGCTVEVLRRETVGECEWLEDALGNGKERQVQRCGKLVVVEALVKPYLQSKSPALPDQAAIQQQEILSESEMANQVLSPSTEQLRITLTGPTMSGKSTLLGTLTTSTLDNGRGQSRMSMLKHRHEISSGVTSSVTQELLGYADKPDGTVDVINFATENIASWIDIHVASSGSRVVFVSDSAGHPRYRRTTVRGLVGWAPHWTLLCISADDTETTAGRMVSTSSTMHQASPAVSEMDLSGAQLDMCIRLRLPLVIVVTKLDLASKAGLKRTLSKILDALKAVGRKPAIVANATSDNSESGIQLLESSMIDGAYNIALPLLNDVLESVPIILTSAVQGTGIRNLHALLHELPVPSTISEVAQTSGFVFYIEDIYTKMADVEGTIVSGRLRMGQISVGDTGVVGPFSIHDWEDSEDSDERPARRPSAHLPTSRSFPGALRNAHLALPNFRIPNQVWRRFKVLSIRNLRLPVHSLDADQIGTIALVADDKSTSAPDSGFNGLRKGMVLSSVQPLAVRTFVAEFKREDLLSLAVGNHVVVYIASVRASARVVSAQTPESPTVHHNGIRSHSNGHGSFDFDDLKGSMDELEGCSEHGRVAGTVTAPNLLVTLTFDSSREYVMLGDQVLLMPGGGPGFYGGQERGEKGLAGLEGFVGKITETYS